MPATANRAWAEAEAEAKAKAAAHHCLASCKCPSFSIKSCYLLCVTATAYHKYACVAGGVCGRVCWCDECICRLLPNHDATDISINHRAERRWSEWGRRTTDCNINQEPTRKQTPTPSPAHNRQTNKCINKQSNKQRTTGVEGEGIINSYEKIPKRQTNCKFSVAFPQNVPEIIRCRQRSKVCNKSWWAELVVVPSEEVFPSTVELYKSYKSRTLGLELKIESNGKYVDKIFTFKLDKNYSYVMLAFLFSS